jgi:hypothetical protein
MSEHAAQSRSLATSPNVTLSYDSADLIKFYQDLLTDINDGKLDQVRKTLVGAMGKIEKEAKVKAEKLSRIFETKDCKYCSGTGFVDHIVGGEKLGVKKCSHGPPQEEIPF